MSESGPPTSDRLTELIELCEADPGAPEFVELGNCYLALSDPRQALQVGARGLEADPSNLPARLMVSRAHMMLHEWKQAQANLLAIVKADRGLSEGFRLLGEVLLRREDYDRALPVLQHAQNLDPAHPQTLVLLKRARARESLGTPPPIPTPVDPTTSSQTARVTDKGSGATRTARRNALTTESEPTLVAEERATGGFSAHRSDRMSLRQDATEEAGAPDMAQDFMDADTDGEPSIRSRLPLRSQHRSVPPPPPPSRSAAERESATEEDVTPPVAERFPASQMGEDYLNQILGGVARTRPPTAAEPEEVLQPDKRWGHSSRRLFAALFGALILAVAGGTGWYLYAKKQRDADVARHLDRAKELLASGAHRDLDAALEESRKALQRDRRSVYAVSVFAEVGALSSLLYMTDSLEAEIATSTAASELDKHGGRGAREVLVAKSALTLALLSNIEAPVDKLTEQRVAIDVWLEEHPEDAWVMWLQGRAMLAAGDRSGARSVFQRAAGADEGLVMAMIDRADMLLDDGDYDRAMKLYGGALERSPEHPLAMVGEILARGERSAELDQAATDLASLSTVENAPLVDAYRNLTGAILAYDREDYATFERNLGKSVGVAAPRFLARAGLGWLLSGEISNAAGVRSRIKWFGLGKPELHPLVAVLDAELYLAYGLPRRALAAIGEVGGVRAFLVRGRAHLDQREYQEALAQFDVALRIAPADRDAQVWREVARFMASRGQERKSADTALTVLREGLATKLPDLLQGWAYAETGTEGARELLEESLKDITPEQPNPLEYRAHVALARLDFDAGQLESAQSHLHASLEQNGGYLPAHGLLGRIQLATGNPAAAVAALQRVVDERMADATLELAYAEALITQPNATDSDRERARQAVKRAVEKGASGDDLSRVAWAVDPALAEALGIAKPAGESGKSRRRRGR